MPTENVHALVEKVEYFEVLVGKLMGRKDSLLDAIKKASAALSAKEPDVESATRILNAAIQSEMNSEINAAGG
jgi:hypothetical protein